MANTAQTEYKFAGAVEIDSIDIIDTAGVAWSLLHLQAETNIYQDLFKPFMKIEIAVSDSAGLINELNGGLKGGELIYCSFKTSDPELEFVKLCFMVNSVSSRVRHNEGNEKYMIEGFSVEYFSTIDKKISKAFGGTSGKPIHQIVNSVFTEFILSPEIKSIYKTLGENKRICDKERYHLVKRDLTSGLHKCIIPQMNPIQAIQYLASDATDDDVASKFLFYENFKGFNFKSLAKLVAEKPKFEDYTYFPSTHPVESTPRDLKPFYIIDMERVKEVDVLENMTDGLFAAKTIELDPLRKKFKITKYKYEEEVERMSKLQESAIKGGANEDAILHLKTSRRGHDTDAVFSKEAPLSSKNVLKDPIRDSYMKHLTNNVLKMTLYGNSELNVGDTIYAEFAQSTTYEVEEGDKYTSGKYLITKLRHKFAKNDYYTLIECVKDTGLE